MKQRHTGREVEPLEERRLRVERRLADQRRVLATQWVALERQVASQERRAARVVHGFRAMLPLGALGGGLWLLRRFGPGRLARPVMFGIAAWRFFRRHIPRLA